MIQHIFKIIWTERRTNLWILFELILVFCILWFCTDYLSSIVKNELEPTNFDIEHTYQLVIAEKDKDALTAEQTAQAENKVENLWAIYDRIKQHPAIEEASYSFRALPYLESSRHTNFYVDSTQVGDIRKEYVRFKNVTPEFFDVFKIDVISGNKLTWENTQGEKQLLISANAKNLFGSKDVKNINMLRGAAIDSDSTKVLGAVARTKRNEYVTYGSTVYEPIKRNDELIANCELAVRVKPEADNNFKEQFRKDMQAQFEIGSYYLASVVSVKDIRDNGHEIKGFRSNFKSIYAISLFLIVNIFLGVIGTFWFRIQSRRSEIGLRISLGASKSGIKKMFITETLILLFMASIVAAVICVNLTIIDVLKDIGVPVIYGEEPAGVSRYFTNYGITLFALVIVSTLAVWYPAKKASDTPPAEALKED